MLKFETYTIEQLEHWLWGFENLKPLRTIFTEEDYQRAKEQLEQKREYGKKWALEP